MGSVHVNEYKSPPVWATYLLPKLIDGACLHAPFPTLVYLFTCLLFILMVLAFLPLSPPCLLVYLFTFYIDGPCHNASIHSS